MIPHVCIVGKTSLLQGRMGFLILQLVFIVTSKTASECDYPLWGCCCYLGLNWFTPMEIFPIYPLAGEERLFKLNVQMQLLIPHIKNSFKAAMQRITLTFVAQSPSWNLFFSSWSCVLLMMRTYLSSITPCRSFSCLRPEQALLEHRFALVAVSSGRSCGFAASVYLFGLKPDRSWIWSFACWSLAVSANWHLSEVSSDRTRHQGSGGGRVVLPCIDRLDFLQATVAPLEVNRI